MALCGCIRIPSCSNPIDMHHGVERSVCYLIILLLLLLPPVILFILSRKQHGCSFIRPSRQPSIELNHPQPHTALQCTCSLRGIFKGLGAVLHGQPGVLYSLHHRKITTVHRRARPKPSQNILEERRLLVSRTPLTGLRILRGIAM